MPQKVNTFSWANVRVFADRVYKPQGVLETILQKKSSRVQSTIIKSTSGTVDAGTLVGIVGPSGSGKTTLLNVLALHKVPGRTMMGSVFYDNQQITQSTRQYVSSYIHQDDVFYAWLTVKEHLLFQAKLRLSKQKSAKDREKVVMQQMEKLNILAIKDRKIGYKEGSGISYGERKRLTFATVMLSDRPVILVDEPTSGLDSHMATVIMKMLHDASRLGKVVIVSIHQPSSQIFKLLDRIMIMTDGVKIMLGTRKQAIALFERSGFPVPPAYNPVDWFLQHTRITYGKNREPEQRRKIAYLSDMWLLYFSEPMPHLTNKVLRVKAPEGPGILRKVTTLTMRQLVVLKSTVAKDTLWLMIFFGAYLGVMFRDAYKDLYVENLKQNVDALGAISLLSSTIYLTQPRISYGLDPVIRREVGENLYPSFVFKLCSFILECPMIFLETFPGLTLFYLLIANLHQPMVLVSFYFYMYILNWVMAGIGDVVASLTRSEHLYFSITTPMSLVFILFSGVIVTLSELPAPLQVIENINHLVFMRLISTFSGFDQEWDCTQDYYDAIAQNGSMFCSKKPDAFEDSLTCYGSAYVNHSLSSPPEEAWYNPGNATCYFSGQQYLKQQWSRRDLEHIDNASFISGMLMITRIIGLMI